MIWIVFALLHGMARAIAVDARRRHQPPIAAITSQAVAAMLFGLPFVAWMDWSQPPVFYLAACLTGTGAGLALLIHNSLHNTRRGRIFNVYMPFEALFAFLIWFMAMPDFRASFLGDPLQITSVALSFVLAIVALSLLRRGDISVSRVLLGMVIGATAAVAVVAVKLVLPAERFGWTGLTFVFIQLATVAFVLAGFTLPTIRDAVPGTRDLARKALLGGGGIALSQTAFVAGLVWAPNPGYVIFTAMLLPVWLLCIHKLRRDEENASPAAALLLVISTVTLLLGAVLSAPT